MNAPIDDESPTPLIDRELSWLAFNQRVLQEAEDPSVPLMERLFFCGIFSSNLDEFFRVRVAGLRSLLRMSPEERKNLGVNPHRLLHEIHRTVLAQQERYGGILAGLVDDLREEGILLAELAEIPPGQEEWLRDYFENEVAEHVEVEWLEPGDGERPFLENRRVYLVVEVWPEDEEGITSWRPTYAMIPLPSPPLTRWVVLPGEPKRVMYLDDVIRFNLDRLFPGRSVGRAYAVKLSRDADLRVEEEFEGDLVDAIRTALSRRETGVPSRFLYDMRAPYVLVHTLQHHLGLSDEDLVVGGRYHNLSDLVGFPRFGRADLSYPEWDLVPHVRLESADSIFDAVREKDDVVHTPYQSFAHTVRFLAEAAADPDVEEICLTVYRVADESEVLKALLDAARAGKKVTVFLEVQARFDERSNLGWGERLEEAGVRTLYSIRGLKVHAKIALVVRRENGERRRYAYVGTGNFNEETATTYTDHAILTAHPGIGRDVEQVFRFLADEVDEPEVEHLLVAPFNMRDGFSDLLDAEAEAARAGRPSGVTLKMNALQDETMVRRLYDAARAGVPIRMIIRGICTLLPGVPDVSEGIEVRSILDRYLEHSRIYRFHAGGEEKLYMASADWMTRNLSRRVEVAVPVYDPDVRAQLEKVLEIQLLDDTRARVLQPDATDRYVMGTVGIRAQKAFRDHLVEEAARAREAAATATGS